MQAIVYHSYLSNEMRTPDSMLKHDHSLATAYLKATDARFFEALWRNAPISEQRACTSLLRLHNAHSMHRTQILSEPALHTADVCQALQQQGLPASLGLAPLLAAQAGIIQARDDIQAKNTATWMRLTPVYWAAARDHVNLHELSGDSMDVADWTQIAQTITPWLNELGWEVFVLESAAYIRVESGFDYHAPSLALAQSDILEYFLPQGADLKRWQTLLTELQMLLHSHPVNTSRAQRGAPPINSFWLDQTARAEQLAPELLAHTALFKANVQAVDYDVSLAELEQLLKPVAEQLRAGKSATLRILSDQPCAIVHQFEFTSATLWQKIKFKWSRHTHSVNPWAWLTPAFDEDSL